MTDRPTAQLEQPRPWDERPSREAQAGTSTGAGGPFRLALPLYLVLLLIAAYVGVTNQQLLQRQAALVADKLALEASVARAQFKASAIEGPAAVATWAVRSGMVPIPEGRVAAVVAPEPAPVSTLRAPVFELRTLWR